SDNDSGFSLDADKEEDELEDAGPSMLGKIIKVNDQDRNGNGVPDFADAIVDNSGDPVAQEAGLSPIPNMPFYELRLSMNDFADGAGHKVVFNYELSDPEDIIIGTNPDFCTDEVELTYDRPANGNIRIWTVPGLDVRKGFSVMDGGDLIVPGEEIDIRGVWGTSVITLFVEGVKPGIGHIDVDFYLHEIDAPCSDRIKYEVAEVDMDIVDLIADPETELHDGVEYRYGVQQIMQSGVPNSKVARLIVRRPAPLQNNDITDRIELYWSMDAPEHVNNGKIVHETATLGPAEIPFGNPALPFAVLNVLADPPGQDVMANEEIFTVYGSPDFKVGFHAVRVFDVSIAGTPEAVQSACDDVRVNVGEERRNRPHLALGGRQARVNRQGVPLPDPDPVGEDAAEWDREPSRAYQDMYRLGTYYSVSDVSIPIVGGELMLEFRRTLAIDRIKQGGEDDLTFSNEEVLGHGWESTLGTRLLITHGVSGQQRFDQASIIDEVGNHYQYYRSGNNWLPDTLHSINNESRKHAFEDLTFTKLHGTKYHFEYVFADDCRHYEYYRLKRIEDRLGNQIVFRYLSPDSILPVTIGEWKGGRFT
ncbi:MAG: hypothetical protein AAF492_16440, partial [Verrucomicrobiota bacterium]